jgi:hypothetical protein
MNICILAVDAILNLKSSMEIENDIFNSSTASTFIPPRLESNSNQQRRRAMSEPWVTAPINRTATKHLPHTQAVKYSMPYGTRSSLKNQLQLGSVATSPNGSTATSTTTTISNSISKSSTANSGGMLNPLIPSSLGDSITPLNRIPTLEEFAAIANKNGRIGIYTKEVILYAS